MRSTIRGLIVVCVCALAWGCAQTSGGKRGDGTTVRGGNNPAERRLKLAVLPVDNEIYPRLAKTLNGLFREVQVQGIDDYFMSKVTLEVVQLSIECVEPTSACYTMVGKSLASQRLLLAQVGPLHPAPAAGKSRRRDKKQQEAADGSLKVTITYFNVEDETPSNVVDGVFKTEDDAAGGLAEMVQKAVTATSVARTK
jgi:hypothetical protein